MLGFHTTNFANANSHVCFDYLVRCLHSVWTMHEQRDDSFFTVNINAILDRKQQRNAIVCQHLQGQMALSPHYVSYCSYSAVSPGSI